MTTTRMTINHATSHVGTIGFPSKMPGTSFGIPAQHCNVGGKLHAVKGSVCSRCYALNGNYMFQSTQTSQQNRFDKLGNPDWREAMTYLLAKYHGIIDGHTDYRITDGGAGYHRWHDAGDIQSESHLDDIVAVCEATPAIKHWLPTREIGLVARWLKARYGAELEQINEYIPTNLCIRFSATMIDGPASARAPNTSTVHHHTKPGPGQRCSAPDYDGHCGPCRRCWNKDSHNTGYVLHG